MAKAARKEEPTFDETVNHDAIKAEVVENPVIILMDATKLDAYLTALRADVDANPGDVKTSKGRDIIKANAAEIGRKKAGIDRERLRATEEWRSNISTVNEAGKVVKERFQALQDEVRAPLTTWEEKEESRKAEAQGIIDDMMGASVIQIGDTSDEIRTHLDRIRSRNLSDELFGPRIEEVTDLRDATVSTLQAALARIEQEEQDRAELEALRAERERRAQEDAARVVRDQEEQARLERDRAQAEAAEQRRQDEVARMERERQEAVERARREAEEAQAAAVREAEVKARAEQERIQCEHEQELAAERRRAEDAERAAQAERDRIAREEADRKAAADRLIEENARRVADQEHRAKRKTAAQEAIMSIGIPETKANKLVQAIVAGDIPHVRLEF
jgi:hypothetical protein